MGKITLQKKDAEKLLENFILEALDEQYELFMEFRALPNFVKIFKSTAKNWAEIALSE